METGNEKCVASRERQHPCQDGNPDVHGDNGRPHTICSLALSAAMPNLPDISAAQRRSLSRDSAFPVQATEPEQLPKNSTAARAPEEENSFGAVSGMRSLITIPLPSVLNDAEDNLCSAGVALSGLPTDYSSFAAVSEREQQQRLRRPVLVSALKHKGRDKCRRTISLSECTPTDRSKIAHSMIRSDSSLGVVIGGETDVPPRNVKTEFSWRSADGGLPRTRRSSSSDCSDRSPLACHSSSILSSSSAAAAAARRRISFPADSVLTAVIQDGDNAELLRLLTGRRGPGVVQTPSVGVDVRQTNHVGLTALHHAILANNLDAAKLLLCHGADVNAQDVHGFSPLHTAAACGSLPLTSLLVLFGADVLALTHEQELPVDVAKDLGVTRLLLGEMTRRLQEDLWLTAFVHARAADAWMLARKLLAWVVLLVLHVLPKIWNTICRHEKRD